MKKVLLAATAAALTISPAAIAGLPYDYITTSSDGTKMYGFVVVRNGDVVAVAQKWMFDPTTEDQTDYYHAIFDCELKTQLSDGRWYAMEMDTTDVDYYNYACKRKIGGGSSNNLSDSFHFQ